MPPSRTHVLMNALNSQGTRDPANRLLWPRPGTVLPLELLADAELAMAKLRQAADAEIDRMAAAESVEA